MTKKGGAKGGRQLPPPPLTMNGVFFSIEMTSNLVNYPNNYESSIDATNSVCLCFGVIATTLIYIHVSNIVFKILSPLGHCWLGT